MIGHNTNDICVNHEGSVAHGHHFDLPDLHYREVRQIQIKNGRVAPAFSAELGLDIWTLRGNGNRGDPAHVQEVADGLVGAHC